MNTESVNGTNVVQYLCRSLLLLGEKLLCHKAAVEHFSYLERDELNNWIQKWRIGKWRIDRPPSQNRFSQMTLYISSKVMIVV